MIQQPAQLVGVNPALLVLAMAAGSTPSPTLMMPDSGCSRLL
ncbi:hypothetical protein ACNKHM_08495 [Shigella sonnei]